MDGRGLGPGLLAAVLSLANDLAAHGKLVGGRRVAVLGVAPDDRVAGLERVVTCANRCGRAVDKELPVRSGLRIIAKRSARVDRRGNGIEVPTPGSHAVIGGEAVLLEERLREVGGGRPRFERIRLSGGPGLLVAIGIDADNRACCCNFRSDLTARSLDVYRRRNIQAGKHRVVRIVGIALGITGKTLTLQTAANRDFRVVFGPSEDKVLMRDNPRFARLEQTIGVLRATGELTKHEAVMSRSLFGGIAPVNAGSLTIHFNRCMQASRYIGGILTVKNALRES